MSLLASLLAALIPMSAYLILLWWSDRNEREPFTKVLQHFLWGAIGAVFFGLLFSYIFNFSAGLLIVNEHSRSILGAVVIAPVIEEIVKSVYLLRTYKKNYFDNLTDGLVYGAAIGLGFGMTENLLYFTVYDANFSEWISVVFIRSLFSAVMHAIATAAVGAILAKIKFSSKKGNNNLIATGLLIAIAIHSLWNLSMSFKYTFIFGIFFMVLTILSFIFLFKYSIKREMKIIADELRDEFNWLKCGIDESSNKLILNAEEVISFRKSEMKKYLNFAAKLAFRKLQAKNSSGLQREIFDRDIVEIKEKLNSIMLSNSQKEV